MVNIFEDLQALGIPVFADGDAPEVLPDSFYVVSEDYTSDHISADNEAQSILYEFTLSFYTTNAEDVYRGILDAITMLKGKGYIVGGVGYSVPSYKGHKRRDVDVEKIDYLK